MKLDREALERATDALYQAEPLRPRPMPETDYDQDDEACGSYLPRGSCAGIYRAMFAAAETKEAGE